MNLHIEQPSEVESWVANIILNQYFSPSCKLVAAVLGHEARRGPHRGIPEPFLGLDVHARREVKCEVDGVRQYDVLCSAPMSLLVSLIGLSGDVIETEMNTLSSNGLLYIIPFDANPVGHKWVICAIRKIWDFDRFWIDSRALASQSDELLVLKTVIEKCRRYNSRFTGFEEDEWFESTRMSLERLNEITKTLQEAGLFEVEFNDSGGIHFELVGIQPVSATAP